MTKIDKWSILAGLRFVLASIVAIRHMEEFTPIGRFGWVATAGVIEALLGFFLISGYSIYISYAKQPDGFLFRRMLRLYPVYLVAMALTYLAFHYKGLKPDAYVLIVNALFLNQIVTQLSFVGAAWSLSLEFWFYCLTPWLMRLSKQYLCVIIWGSFACYLVYTVLRTLAHLPYYSGVPYGLNLILLSWIWVSGFRLARAKDDDKTVMRDIGLIFCGHIAVTVIIQFFHRMKHHAVAEFFSHDAIEHLMQFVTMFFVYLVFKKLVLPERRDAHRSRFLRMLGDISYPLYLIHDAVYFILAHFGFVSPPFFFLVAVVLSAVIYWSLDFYSRRRHQQVGTT